MKEEIKKGEIMSEEKDSEEKERPDPEDKMKEMREKMKEMQGAGGPQGFPPQMGNPSLMSRMAGMGGGPQSGPQSAKINKAMMETLQKLNSEMNEIKTYLKEISETLKER